MTPPTRPRHKISFPSCITCISELGAAYTPSTPIEPNLPKFFLESSLANEVYPPRLWRKTGKDDVLKVCRARTPACEDLRKLDAGQSKEVELLDILLSTLGCIVGHEREVFTQRPQELNRFGDARGAANEHKSASEGTQGSVHDL